MNKDINRFGKSTSFEHFEYRDWVSEKLQKRHKMLRERRDKIEDDRLNRIIDIVKREITPRSEE